MNCENVFCIYWSSNKCSLDDIYLNIQGNCQNCIYINLDEKIIESERNKLLDKYNN